MRDTDASPLLAIARASRGVTFRERMGEIAGVVARWLPDTAFGATIVAEVGGPPLSPDLSFSGRFSRPELDAYYDRYVAHDPFPALLRASPHEPVLLSERLTAAQRARNPWVSEHLGRHGIREVCAAARWMPDGTTLLFGITSTTRRMTPARARRFVAAAAGDIARAAHGASLRARLLAHEEPGVGEVLLDSAGAIVHADLCAWAVLERSGRDFQALQDLAAAVIARPVASGWTSEHALSFAGSERARVRVVKLDPRSGLGAVALVERAGPARAHETKLTAREREVVALAVTGVTNAAIARALGLSRDAVKWHLKKIFRKTGVSSRTELAALHLGGIS